MRSGSGLPFSPVTVSAYRWPGRSPLAAAWPRRPDGLATTLGLRTAWDSTSPTACRRRDMASGGHGQ